MMLRKFFKRWKALSIKIGNFQARVILTVFYFSIFLPFGIAVRLLSDPLSIRKRDGPFWVERPTEKDRTLEEVKRQF